MEMNEDLKEIVDALTTGSYFAEMELAASDISVEVNGLGEIKLPIGKEHIEQLIGISSKAKFGLGEKTVHDERVRDSHEIKSDELTVTIDESLTKNMMIEIREALGLAEDNELLPFLYNMLIYGPGQFFSKHKDNEKLENMVATLVIVLPSPHIGGDLVVEHGKQKYTFSSENIGATSPKCFAFYADCEHEIQKVKDGYRVSLTYNVVLQAGETQVASLKVLNPNLHIAVEGYFGAKKRRGDGPKKLVYLLEYTYSKNGLRWSLLKGADRTNSFSFFASADKLGLACRLALLEIDVCMSVGGDSPTEGSSDSSDGDFVEARTEITHCVDTEDKSVSLDMFIAEDEICWTKDNKSFEPFDVDDTGYTGNEGRSKDYWYKRAAIILYENDAKTQKK